MKRASSFECYNRMLNVSFTGLAAVIALILSGRLDLLGDIKSNSSRTVLVVEDDEGIRDTLRIFLELEGYTAFTAKNGQDGIDVLQTIPNPCLILLDLMMPVMNGWEFIEVISKDAVRSSIPIVIVTAYADQASTINARGIIKKPIDLDVLSKVVKKWCEYNPPVGVTK